MSLVKKVKWLKVKREELKEMKEGWEIKKLGEITTTINGLWKGKKPPYINVAVIRNTNFSKDCKLNLDDVEYLDVESKQFATRKLEFGDIIIEKSGGSDKHPVGRPVLFDVKNGEYSFSNFTSTLRIKDKNSINPSFLQKTLYNLYLQGKTRCLQSHTTGIHNLDFNGFLNFDIPIPPLSEQQRIVSILDAAFEKIDALKANAEANLKNAKDLFQQVLKKELEPKEGWKEKKMNEICDITSPLVNPKDSMYNKLLHVGGANIVSESGCLIDLKTAEEEGLESAKFTFDENMVLYNKIRPYLKKVAKPNFSGLCSADMYPISPKSCVNRGFLYYILISEDFTEYAIKNSGRAGMPKINRNALFAYNCFIPSLPEQRRIVSVLDSLSEKCKRLEENYSKTMAECDALKQAILKEVMNAED